MINIKSQREIQVMKESCRLAAETLSFAGKSIEVGMTTEELNTLVHNYIVERGAYPSPLNYRGFPKSVCTSLNSVVCHGIPSGEDTIKNGDILNIDVTTYLNKFHGDTNRTFLVGEVSSEAKRLVGVTYQCMMEGIKEVAPGKHLGDIGAAIFKLATANGYSVVRDYCGHGIGREFHEEPQVLHYGEFGTGPILKKGMTFTIEPMINMGQHEVTLLDDEWTVVTADGSLSAQFEHTILVTDDGYEIMTPWPDGEK